MKTYLLAALLVSLSLTPEARAVEGAHNTENAPSWTACVWRSSREFGIPVAWIEAVISAESGGQTHLKGRPVTSSAGAMGLMQLMPRTYAEMRDIHRLGPDPHDPCDNIRAGTAYLRQMYDRFGYPGLFAAYNAGPQRYERSLRGAKLPKETRDYLAKLTRNPAQIESGLEIFVILNRENLDTKSQQSSGLFVPLREVGRSDD